MTKTMDLPETTRVMHVAPPEEADSTDWWLAASKFLITLVEENREVFDNEYLTRPSVWVFQRSIFFSAYGLRELKLFMSMLPVPTEGKWEKDSEGQPILKATINGWNFELRRVDLTCEMVETGEVEEYEDTEVVQEAITKPVTKERPVYVKECPPILSE